MINQIKKNFTDAQKVLDAFITNETNWIAFEKAGQLMAEAIKEGHIIFSCGNGGSMCDAMHFAEELSGRFRLDRPSLPAIAISDASHISCVGNDYGFEFIFSRFLEGIGKQGDVLMAISTSGNSKNVVNAARTAKLKGIKVVALTGKDGGELASLCDVEFRIPDTEFADRVQEIHIKIIHSLIQYIEFKVGK
jgi:D-sedoheptulose 7-phosphate isomerase